MLLSIDQMSGYKDAAFLLPNPPNAKELIVDQGYNADWFRQALLDKTSSRIFHQGKVEQ